MPRGATIQDMRAEEDLYTCFPEPDPDYLNDDNDDEEGKTFHPPDAAADFPPPPPPCSAEELSAAVAEAYSAQHSNGIAPTADGLSPADAPLIKPKPLVNPCLESRERQALHRELLMNYKIGKDVLKKPELDKVMRDRREVQRKKEWDEQKSNKGRTSLEIKLEERANRMKEEEEKKMKVIVEESQTPELVRIQRKILKSSGTGEQS
ncbi:protein FAM107B-like isoform X2 [Biomphalaria glabrata]|uniref:Protein FAM107B-like isoform X2 n=1 Tax=Biomphalaria glabrata TaxID=6526 RepID=A0A9W3A8F5_BIOGL|nr:protein FAM107B-like isoform X2 [Biomphalaria glabrata]